MSTDNSHDQERTARRDRRAGRKPTIQQRYQDYETRDGEYIVYDSEEMCAWVACDQPMEREHAERRDCDE